MHDANCMTLCMMQCKALTNTNALKAGCMPRCNFGKAVMLRNRSLNKQVRCVKASASVWFWHALPEVPNVKPFDSKRHADPNQSNHESLNGIYSRLSQQVVLILRRRPSNRSWAFVECQFARNCCLLGSVCMLRLYTCSHSIVHSCVDPK